MKKRYTSTAKALLLFVSSFLFAFAASAQAEKESNNDFATANPASFSGTATGSVCSGDVDYYKFVVPRDGTVRVHIEATNSGANWGTFQVAAYDQRQADGQLFSVTPAYYSNGGSLSVQDADAYCRSAGDTIYLAVWQANECFSYKLSFAMQGQSTPNDAEPNNSYSQAILFNVGDTVRGHIGYVSGPGITGDADYFKTVLPSDGVYRVYMEATNTGSGSGNFYVAGFDRRQDEGLLLSRTPAYYSNPGGVSVDSVDLYCRAAGDTLYFRLTQASQCFSYKIMYRKISSPSFNDLEANNSFLQATTMKMGDTAKGHIGYVLSGDVADNVDYFKTVLPKNGRYRVIMEAINTGNGSGHLYVTGYDQRRDNGLLFSRTPAYYSNPGNVTVDSVDLFCRAAGDTLYFRVTQSSQCFDYRITYKLISTPGDNDLEPNNTFDKATFFATGDSVRGHIGYVAAGDVTDAEDIFKTVVPKDGIVRVYMEATNTGNGSGHLYVTGYDQRRDNGLLFSRTPAYYSNPGDVTVDSVDLYGRSASDTIYFKMSQSAQCFSYKLRYKVISPDINNDAEPNNSFVQATYFRSGDVMQGHIGYTNGIATDAEDHFKTLLPAEGSIKVRVEVTNTGNGSGNFYVNLYDSEKNSIASRTVAYYSNPGSTILDSFIVSCRGIDTTFFQVTYSGQPYVYKVSYEMVSVVSGSSETEPNNDTNTPTLISAGDTVKGKVGSYSGKGTDFDDYFQANIPYKGTVKIYLEAVNDGNGTGSLFFSGYDQNLNTLFDRTPAYYTGTGQVSTDNITLYCQNPGPIYFRVRNNWTCYSYTFRYIVTLGRDTTVAACSGCTTDISKLYDVTPFSSVTYENMAAPGTPVDPKTVKAGSYRLTVFNGTDECSRDTALISVTTGQVIHFDTIPDKVYGAAPFAVKATSSEGLPVSYRVLNGPATINGSIVTITGVGSVTVRAEQAGNGSVNYAFADRTFNVAKAPATVTLSGLAKVYDGKPAAPKAVTNPASLPVTFTYNGAPDAPVNAGNYEVVATVNSSNYSGTAKDSVRIQKASQSISLLPLPDQSYSATPVGVSVSATSGLPVTLALATTPSGIATLTGNYITLSGTGTIIVRATQEGNGNYIAAAAVADTFLVTKGAQIINFTSIPDRYIGDTVKLHASASSSLAVTYSMVTTPAAGIARLSRDTIYLNGTSGSVTVTASQAGNSTYNSAQAQHTFKVLGRQQAITFDAVPNKIFGDPPFAIKATASSGLPVSFRIVSGPATISNNVITLTGDGTVAVEASQEGSTLYAAATPVQRSFVVTRKYPDLVVQQVTSAATSLGPNDSATVAWNIGNVGNLTAMTDWTERIYIQSSAGENRTLLKQVAYRMADSVLVNKSVARSEKVVLPSQVVIGDNGVFVVEVTPGATAQEAPVTQTNNVGVQAAAWAVKKLLRLDLSTAQITEGAGGTTATISRTGSLAGALTVSLQFTNPSRFVFPATITIPAGQVAQNVTIAAVNNTVIEGTKLDSLRVVAAGFTGAKASLSILDNDKPALTFTLLPAEAMEGQTVAFRVSTDMTLAQPLPVYLTSNNQPRFPVPASVAIPAGARSADITVSLAQDVVPEINAAVSIMAAAENHTSANAAISVKDDDIPGLELVLQTNMVSEGAGYFATRATLRRTAGSPDIAFTANLTSTVPNTLILPAAVSLGQGENEKTFDIGVVDNTVVDGSRNVGITASIYVASCGCSAPPTSSGTVTATLAVTDNDGPALTVSATQLTLPEGLSNAGTLRIARNTATTSALTVSLASSNTAEATVPATVTIAAGQSAVEVPIATLNDNVADGNKQVYFQATAGGFAAGSVWVMVSDQNKPDLQVPAVMLGSSSVQAMGVLNYGLTVSNTGFATAPAGVVVRGYLSKDDQVDAADSLLSQDVLSEAVSAGGSRQLVNAVKVPDLPGTYKVIYVVNQESALTELLTSNNTSTPATLAILPDYTATATVQNAWYLKGAAIPITGTATRANGSAAVNEKVEVYVIVNGLRRTVSATTDATGKFTAQFVPLANEAGRYSVGAGFPGLGATAEQDAFDILGVKINGGDVPQFKVTLKDTLKGTVPVLNRSGTSLTKFSLVPVLLPNGATVRFDTVAVLAGNATVNLGYRIVGASVSPGGNFEAVSLNATAQEGVIQEAKAWYYCKAPNAFLEASLTEIKATTSATAGEKVVQFTLANKGLSATGDVTVILPQVPWLGSITPVSLPSIAPGDTAVVALRFLATTDVPFDYPIKGSLAISSQHGNTVTIPFAFEKVSQTTGSVKVVVTDQFTYYSAAAPKVKGAHVVIKNYYTGQVYADGYTDDAGALVAASLPEGRHRITVDKEQHQPFTGTVTVAPGRTVEETVFLNYQAITFNWKVVPTAVQDQYEITLETKFETNVPVPVVTVEMPKKMPKLTGSETYAFNVILTNHGLITAKEVKLGLPADDPEYEFVTNYLPGDLVAQQSVEVPVIMRRRTTGITGRTGLNVQGISQFLGMDASQYRTAAAAAANGSGACEAFTMVSYWYKCNFSTGLWEKGGTLFSYDTRSCTGGPTPAYTGVPIDVGGVPTSDDGGYNDVPCAECGPGNGIVIPNPFPPTPNEKKSCKDCIDEIKNAMGCPAPPSPGDAGKCVAGNVIKGAEWTDYIECIPIKLPPPVACLLAVNKAADKCAGIGMTGRIGGLGTRGRMTGTSPLGAVFDRIAGNLKTVERAMLLTQAWVKEYYGDMTGSDALPSLASHVQSSVRTLDSIRQGRQDSVLAAMAGYELQPAAIQAFFTRWNTSVHARRQGVLAPNATYPTIINWTKAKAFSDSIVLLHKEAVAQGFESVDDMYFREYKALDEFIEQEQNAVCASVTMQLSQRLTMTREAFDGTLEIFNGHPTDKMDSLRIAIRITDANGAPANHLFEIQTGTLTNLANVTGTGAIPAQQTGGVKFLFIPTINAAPVAPQTYNFGGSVTYWDPYAQGMVTMPLSAIPLTVNPSPNLMLHYFMQRNILGDDALTSPDIEPSVPAELAVMVENQGNGPAVNMIISSAQPKITDNEKGLAINFQLIGSAFQGQAKKLGVTDINFGTIPALQTRIGQWYFTSSLLGKFVDYDAKVVHGNSFGNPELSLVKGVKLHELTKSIKLYGSQDDGINDFLVNDVFDTKDVPDALYHSQGGRTSKVLEAATGSFSAPVAPPAFTNTLTVTPSGTGWNYIKLDDPGKRLYEIASVTRSNGQVIPLDNAWLTFVTLPLGQAPKYENKFHFVDTFSTVSPASYTVVWKPRSTDIPKVDTITGAPKSVTATQVQSLKVKFNKAIDPATFTYADLNLTVQGGANIMNNTVVITQEDTATFNVDLTALTKGNGFYVFTVQAANVADVYGVNGQSGRQATWTQSLNAPIVQSFQGLPDSRMAPSYDKMQPLFNLPVDVATVTSARFTVLKNGVAQPGTITVDSVRTDHKLFYLSGLKNILTTSGVYEFRVDLPNIKSEGGVPGAQAQSIFLTVDNSGPVVMLAKATGGALDVQHIPFVSIGFNEGVSGFNTASLMLTRNGQLLPLTYDQLNMTDAKTWMAGSFGMLTYPDGAYTFTINMAGVKDSSGNSGTGTKQLSWVVDRTSVVSITNLGITPDKGYSTTDGVTAEQAVNVTFTLGRNASQVVVYQYDLSGQTVLATKDNVAAGAVSIPVSLAALSNTGVRVVAIGATGGQGAAEKALFIDQVPLTGEWTMRQYQNLTRQMDTVSVSLSNRLLSTATFKAALSLRRNGASLSTSALTFRAVNDTLYEVRGLRSTSTAVGDYELSLDLQQLSKYTSGKGGNSYVALNWGILSTNRAPMARAGRDTTITQPGLVTLDARASNDPDADVLAYRWVAPQGVTLSDTASATPTFTATQAMQGNSYPFLLIVNDGLEISTATVNVTIRLCGTEVCNGMDDDCDGLIDEGFATTFYKDNDGDGFGAAGETVHASQCSLPAGYAAYGGDCDDASAAVYPGSEGDGCNTCATDGITFYSGNGATFQWQVDKGGGFTNISDNSVYSGTAQKYLVLKQPPTSWYGYNYRCLVTTNGVQRVTPVRVLTFSFTWKGSAGSAWENPLNWSCNRVPDQYTDVKINNTVPVVIGSTATARSVTLSANSKVTITKGALLNVKK